MERNRRRARRRNQADDVPVGAKLQRGRVDSALDDVRTRPPPSFDRDFHASGNPLQRVESVVPGLKRDVVRKSDLCSAVVVGVVGKSEKMDDDEEG